MTATTPREGRRELLRQLVSLPVIVLSIGLFAVYLLFDMRENTGDGALTSTSMVQTEWYGIYGDLLLAGTIVLDALLAIASAVLMVASYQLIRNRRAAGATGAATTGGSLLLAFFAFGFPGCPLPVLAFLGVTFFASSLPLYGLEFKLLALLIVLLVLVYVRRKQRAVPQPAE